MKRIFTFSVT